MKNIFYPLEQYFLKKKNGSVNGCFETLKNQMPKIAFEFSVVIWAISSTETL
jgi:hypothetical protein